LEEMLGEETLEDGLGLGGDEVLVGDEDVEGEEMALGLEEAQAAGVDLGDDVLNIFEGEEAEDETLAAMASTLKIIDAGDLFKLCQKMAAELEEHRPEEEPEAAA